MDKKISPFDALISELEFGLEILINDNSKKIEQSKIKTDQKLTADEIKKSIQNIRVNHVGEVCAQGLYRGKHILRRIRIFKKNYIPCVLKKKTISNYLI